MKLKTNYYFYLGIQVIKQLELIHIPKKGEMVSFGKGTYIVKGVNHRYFTDSHDIAIHLEEVGRMKTLTELTAEYYDLIGKDHHKDKDCHFYIQKTYSYGDEPYWQYQFLHYGYCWSVENFFQDDDNVKKYQESCKYKFPQRQTEQEAEQDMRNFLEWVIEKEKMVQDGN